MEQNETAGLYEEVAGDQEVPVGTPSPQSAGLFSVDLLGAQNTGNNGGTFARLRAAGLILNGYRQLRHVYVSAVGAID